VAVTEVNVTFTFRVPAQPPAEPPSRYTLGPATPPDGWLISTERWTPEELSLLASASAPETPVGVAFSEGQVQYSWVDAEGAHILLARIEAVNGDLQATPTRYTLDGNPGDAEAIEDRLYAIREGLLLNSIPPGEFNLARVELSDINLELVFLVPPQ
jgi:hypothetical protein